MGERLPCKQGVSGSNPLVSIGVPVPACSGMIGALHVLRMPFFDMVKC